MKTVKSVHRAVQILECLASGHEMTLTDIRATLRMPKTTAHEIITTLAASGVVQRDGHGNLYRLGLKLFELGMKAQADLEIRRVATPLLKDLNSRCNESVHLTVLDAGEVLYIESFQSSKNLRTYSAVGLRAPLHCTGVGKAILAFLEEAEIDAIIKEKGLRRFTAHTITSAKNVLVDIQRIRRRGFSIDDCEHEEGVRCVGAPIHDHEARVVASLSISAPVQRMPDGRIPEFGNSVIAVANEVSRLLGCPARHLQSVKKGP